MIICKTFYYLFDNLIEKREKLPYGNKKIRKTHN